MKPRINKSAIAYHDIRMSIQGIQGQLKRLHRKYPFIRDSLYLLQCDLEDVQLFNKQIALKRGIKVKSKL